MQLMEQINSKKPVSKVIRDSLIFKLHFNHNHSVLEISEMFKLTQQYTITLLNTLQRQNNSSQIQEDELAEPIPSDIRIENLIMEQIDSKIGSVTATSLQQKVLSQLGIQISKSAIKFCMKYKLGLSWKRMSHNDPYVNTQQNLKLRRHFAIELIEQIKLNKIILNFDESVLQFSDNSNFSWEHKNQPAHRLVGKKVQGLSIMAAISSIGEVYFQYINGYNNEATVASFLMKLEQCLTKLNPFWRNTHILLMDNCSSHKTKLVRKVLSFLEIPTLFSAPASYKAMPIELLFGAIKKKQYLTSATPEIQNHDSIKNKKLSNKQRLMLEIGEYLKTIEVRKVKSIFFKQLMHLEDFIMEKKV